MDNSFLVNGLNVAELGDDELLERLQKLGFTPGPILATTREVYQRKLARLLRNEDYDDLEEDGEPLQASFLESPVLNSSFESSYTGSPSMNFDDLRRRPLSRVEGEKWSDDPPILSPHKPWSPDDIVSQVQPPPEEEKPLISTTTMIAIIIAFLFFAFLVYYNMESSPQAPFS